MMSTTKATNAKEPSTQQVLHKKKFARFVSEITFYLQRDWGRLQYIVFKWVQRICEEFPMILNTQ